MPDQPHPAIVTARWLHDDPTAAAAWLRSLPADRSTTAATEFLFRQWGGADPTSAGAFLANNPESPN